ncbi:hypothetical protein SAMN04487770_13126 [Butyrivibrio sp. ob235]|uniref:DUF6311 domain-containing protein n=1 Tax=Butyrivibrio sp. ob235 TaxID=1761780 RepID=UPI0008D071C4|nr:DUF6311 domain-containing protein [Butyrivibrio sp. ob235]SEM26566.1 hypothetical protein SAMN04487770_13126 [Butyrivibrio sp. ob235]
MDTIKKDNNKIIVGFVSAILGMLMFITIYGLKVLDFTYDDWILTGYSDLIQHYLGWVSFRNTPWKFPIGLIDGIIYPDSISVIYTDSIPLFAIVFKALSPILPSTFQYMGLWGIICYTLQGMYGGLLIYKFSGKKLYSIIGSVFFASSAVMMQRMFYHTALAGQWLILASLYYWFEHNEKVSDWKAIRDWSILSILALLSEAYFLPMVWGIMLCALLQEIMRKKAFSKAFSVVVFAMSGTLLVGYIYGLFYGHVPSAGGGLGVFSFNLNGFFNPQGISVLFRGLPFRDGQGEGYAYLGAGVFLLIIVALIHFCAVYARNNKVNMDKTVIIPMIFFFVGFTCYAISPTVTFGLSGYEIQLPKTVFNLLSTFRSSGRLIWPVYYMIYLVVIGYIGKAFNKKSLAIILVFAACSLQLYELKNAIISRRNVYYNDISFQSSLQSDAWNELADNYEHIVIYPNTFKMFSNVKGEHIWLYAQENDMTMNVVYLSRDITGSVNKAVKKRFKNLEGDREYADTMYVFIDELPEDDKGLHYYYIDDVVIGVPRVLQCESVQEMSLEDIG